MITAEFYYPVVIRVTEQCEAYLIVFFVVFSLFLTRCIHHVTEMIPLLTQPIHLCISIEGLRRLELIPACIGPEAATFTQISDFSRHPVRGNFCLHNVLRIEILKADSANHLATWCPRINRAHLSHIYVVCALLVCTLPKTLS